jgi:hypothetical protein
MVYTGRDFKNTFKSNNIYLAVCRSKYDPLTIFWLKYPEILGPCLKCIMYQGLCFGLKHVFWVGSKILCQESIIHDYTGKEFEIHSTIMLQELDYHRQT